MAGGRPAGSKNGKGHELARRWAAAYGSSPQMTREAVGPKTAFPDYKTVQEIQRRMAVVGYHLRVEDFDAKRKLYSLSPEDVDRLTGELQA
jgi:hypothetical protein